MTVLIEESLTDYLAADADLIATVVDRIYPSTLPQNPELPAIVYKKIKNMHIQSHKGSSGLTRPGIEFTCWGSTYSQSKVLAELLRLALEGYRGKMGGDDGVNVYAALSQDERDDYNADLDLYAVIFNFALWHEEAVPSGVLNPDLSPSMHGFPYEEQIICNGSETEFIFDFPFVKNSLELHLQRMRQIKNVDYTEKTNRTGTTYNTAPRHGWMLIANYIID